MRKRFKNIAALTLTLIIVFPLAIVAANWQLNRHHERESLNQQISRSYEKSPIKIANLSQVNPNKRSEYERFSLEGEVTSNITWWRRQSLDGLPGFIGLVTYEVNNEEIVLALGWSQSPVKVNVDLSKIVARLRFIDDFSSDPNDLPDNQTNSPSTILPGKDRIYFELVEPKIMELVQIPLPEITAGPHLGYVGQWILIGIFSVVVYIIAIRNLPKD